MVHRGADGEFYLDDEETLPMPNNWYCGECGTEFWPKEHQPEKIACPTCGKILHRGY